VTPLDFSFAHLSIFRPSKLTAAVSKLRDFDVEPLDGQQPRLWELFLQKLRDGRAITNGDRMVGLINFLMIPPDLRGRFQRAFEAGLPLDLLRKAIVRFCEDFQLPDSVGVLLQLPQGLFAGVYFPPSVSQLRSEELAYTEDNIVSIARAGRNQMKFVLGLAVDPKRSRFTAAQIKVLNRLSSRGNAARFLDGSMHSFVDVFLDGFENPLEAASLVNQFLESYLEEVASWKTEVLSKSKPIGVFLEWLRQTHEDKRRILLGLPSVREILKQHSLILEVLKDLEAIELERADYWSRKLEFCSFVETRKFRNGRARVGVAFGIGQYVIVEFAPRGNAAMLYSASDFERSIRSKDGWRVPELGQAYEGLTEPGAPGSIWHRRGWQGVADRLIEAIRF
jgi:hypothetical protein